MQVKIGTRGSPLAVAQAREVQSRLMAAHSLTDDALPIVEITTSGDRIQHRPLSEVGGKGLFAKEIEDALGDRRIDIAVHSMKDLETVMPAGLVISAVLKREDVRDAFVSHRFANLDAMPAGAVVGTSSVRRRAQLLHRRPDLVVVEFRGNVETRLQKLDDGVADATFLACAGLRRLGRDELLRSPIDPTVMLPAVAQGAIAVQQRQDDQRLSRLLEPIGDHETAIQTAAERAFLARLDGSCRTPIAGLATFDREQLCLRGQILRCDGSESLEVCRRGPLDAAERLGVEAAEELLSRASSDFIVGSRT